MTKPNATVNEIRAKIEAARARLAEKTAKIKPYTGTGREWPVVGMTYELMQKQRNSGANCGFLDDREAFIKDHITSIELAAGIKP